MLALGLGSGTVVAPLGNLVELEEVTAYLGALTGSNSTEVVCWTPSKAYTVKAVKLVDITGITGHTQNYATMTIYNRGAAGTGTAEVAAKSTDTTAKGITAKSAWDVTVSGTAANLVLAAGDTVTAKLTEAGTGQDLAGAALTFHVAPPASATVHVFTPQAKVKITRIALMNQAAITANGSNYGTLTVANKGAAGSGSTTVASRATDTVTTDDVTANVPWELVLSSTAANLYVEAGESLMATWAKTGTGDDLTGASLVVDFVYATGQEV